MSGLLRNATKILVWAGDYDRSRAAVGQTWADMFKKHPDALDKVVHLDLGTAENSWWQKQEHSYEFPALQGLWEFCQHAPDVSNQAVLYMHTKGSTHAHWRGEAYDWRHVMNHFALGRRRTCRKCY